jgi:hypothetical protein
VRGANERGPLAGSPRQANTLTANWLREAIFVCFKLNPSADDLKNLYSASFPVSCAKVESSDQ